MSEISEYTIQQVLDTVHLEDLVSRYTELRPSGKNFKGNCPLHSDEDSSLLVLPKHKLYKCTSCESMGNVFVFLMEMQGITFPESVYYLAEMAGIDVIETKAAHEIKKTDLYHVIQEAVEIYHEYFRHSDDGSAKNARTYMRRRGFTNETLLEHKIGYAPEPNGWNFLIRQLSLKYDFPLLEKAGLVFKGNKSQKFYDYFRNRILFPWFDAADRPIGFGGRTMSAEKKEVKYLNTRQTLIFEKQKNLYLLNIARKLQSLRELVVVEGYTDGLMAHQENHKNTVATAGTAFTRQHALLLKRISDRAIFCFDSDSAGKAAAITSARTALTTEIDPRIVALQEGKDPADVIKENPDIFETRLNEAMPLFEFVFEDALNRHSIESAHDKAIVLKELAPFIYAAPDAPTCRVYINETAKRMGLEYDVVAELVDYRTRSDSFAELKLSPFPTKIYEEQLACVLLRKVAYRNYLTMELSSEQFFDTAISALFSYFSNESAKDDAVPSHNSMDLEPSLFDDQRTENLPAEVIAHARKNDMPVNEAEVYKLISTLQRMPSPKFPPDVIVNQFLKARYRYDLQQIGTDIESAHSRKDEGAVEELMQQHTELIQKLRFSNKDSLK
ncbi:DNA primase [Candidatus Woesearchaeota archaeon]|nr:DNA primase [Candidatus Woesearchaeota archaeon]MBW2994028.1 DNA primase [Candidatus Woesearchaeota archaeon]